MTLGETLITISVLAALVIIIYTRVKKQNLKDTLEEIKDIFTRKGGDTKLDTNNITIGIDEKSD